MGNVIPNTKKVHNKKGNNTYTFYKGANERGPFNSKRKIKTMKSRILYIVGMLAITVSETAAFSGPMHSMNARHRENPVCNNARRFMPIQKLKMSDSSNLLYQEAEKVLVNRGEVEETLVSDAMPIKANLVKLKGVGKAGGFGGRSATSASSLKKANNAEAKAHSKVLIEEGVVRIDNILSEKVVDRLKSYLYDLRQTSEQEIEKGLVKPLDRFANVLLKQNRCDLTIPLGNDIVSQALNEALRISSVGATISSILGEDCILHEFSCLMSDPGSQRQVIHPDTPFIPGKGPVLYTCFIALQDVRPDMGPTVWFPNTHTEEAHNAFKNDSMDVVSGESKKDQFIRSRKAVLGLLPKGSCAIFDSRLLHCGTANQSNDSRALFYFSFKNPSVGYTGNPASIRPDVGKAMISMKTLVSDLERFAKGKK
jgi:ectoine hydroxylase-related dioxygenase (phytanoyl-CoA dioxygenase family)